MFKTKYIYNRYCLITEYFLLLDICNSFTMRIECNSDDKSIRTLFWLPPAAAGWLTFYWPQPFSWLNWSLIDCIEMAHFVMHLSWSKKLPWDILCRNYHIIAWQLLSKRKRFQTDIKWYDIICFSTKNKIGFFILNYIWFNSIWLIEV